MRYEINTCLVNYKTMVLQILPFFLTSIMYRLTIPFRPTNHKTIPHLKMWTNYLKKVYFYRDVNT